MLWFYDRARASFGLGTGSAPSAAPPAATSLCSSRRGARDLYCAVNEAGPTDLRTIQQESAYNSATGLYDQTFGGRWVHNIAAAAFGDENVTAISPAAQVTPTLTTTRLLQGTSADDPLVPYAQAGDLAGRDARRRSGGIRR